MIEERERGLMIRGGAWFDSDPQIMLQLISSDYTESSYVGE